MHRKFNKIQRKIATTDRERGKKREHKIKETTEQKRKNNKIKSNRRKWVDETTRTNIRMLCLAILCYVAFVHDSNDVFIYVSCFFPGGDCCFRCCSVKTIFPCLLAFTSINYMVMKWTRGSQLVSRCCFVTPFS